MNRNAGRISNMWVILLGSVVLLAVLLTLLFRPAEQTGRAENGNGPQGGEATKPTDKDGSKQSLLLFCAAGIKLPVAAAAKSFQDELGIDVQLQYAGSGTLLNNLRVAKKGDLYLAADVSYIELAREYNLLDEAIPLGRQRPVIAVRKGNPKNIRSVQDLLRDDVQFALANPDAASVGKTTQKVLQKTGEWEAVRAAVKVLKPTVNDVATDVLIGAVDAGVVWSATVKQIPKLDMVHTPEFDAAEQEITIGVLKTCRHSAAALQVARYLQAPERGQKEFARNGYESLDGDAWAEAPTITLFSGGVNRLAIQDTLAHFESREGVKLNIVFNGCGILVGQMKAGFQPDAYFACDASYMVQVRDKFRQPLTISRTDMVVIVQKGNPKGIEKLADLAQPGLKLGVANEKQSALGALTRRLLEKLNVDGTNLYEAIQPNISVRTPTADLLVNQLRAGGLDAAVVYRVNVAMVKDELEVITITQGDPAATQPIAVSKTTKYPYLTNRLVDAITSNSSRGRFENVGFQWRAGLRRP